MQVPLSDAKLIVANIFPEIMAIVSVVRTDYMRDRTILELPDFAELSVSIRCRRLQVGFLKGHYRSPAAATLQISSCCYLLTKTKTTFVCVSFLHFFQPGFPSSARWVTFFSFPKPPLNGSASRLEFIWVHSPALGFNSLDPFTF